MPRDPFANFVPDAPPRADPFARFVPDQPSPAPAAPSTGDRIREAAFTPALKSAGAASLTDVYDLAAESAARLASKALGTPVSKLRADFPAVAFVNQLARTAPEALDFLLSPGGAAATAAARVPGLTPAVGAAFTIDMASHLPEAWEAVKRDPSAENVAGLIKTGLFTALPGIHAGAQWGRAGRVGKSDIRLAPEPEPTARQQREQARRERTVAEQAAAEARRADPFANFVPDAEPAPQPLNRAQRRAGVMPPETGAPEPYQALIDPRLSELSQEIGLGDYAKLSEADRAVVRQLRDEGVTARKGAKPSDQKDQPRLPGEVGERQEPVQTQPVEATGREAAETGRILQAPEGQVAPAVPVEPPAPAPQPPAVAPAPPVRPPTPTQPPAAAPAPAVPAPVAAEKPAYDYSSTQVNLPDPIANRFRQAAARIPDKDLAAESGTASGGATAATGRENQPHITVKYGLHTDQAEAVRKLLEDEPPIRVKFGKASVFPPSESSTGDVVKVDIESADLHRLNKKIADALPHTDTHPDYKPHATIAYVKPGLGTKYAGKPVPGISGQEITLDRLVFSSKTGEQVEIPLAGKAGKGPAAPRPAPFLEALDKLEREAKERIAKRWQEAGTTLSAGPGLAVEQLADYAIVGAVKIARLTEKGAVKFAQWSAEMIREYGKEIEPHLGKIWMRAQRIYKEQSEGGAGKPPATTRTAVAELPEPGGAKPRVTATGAGTPEPRVPVTSPSYDVTKSNILKRVSPEVRAGVESRMADFEARNPERRVVTFRDIEQEARSLDPAIVGKLDWSKLKQGETLDPAVRFAARETLNGLEQEIAARDQRLANRDLPADVRDRTLRQREQLEQDARRLIDVLIPTRSQDGRNLAYHRMMAEGSFDATYWLSRARRAMAIPEDVRLPEDVQAGIEAITRKGQAAERRAIERVRPRKKAEAQPRPEAQPGETEVTRGREEIVEQKHKELIARLKRAIAGEETSTVNPVSPEERAAWERDPEVLSLRAELAGIRGEKAALARQDVRRADIVEARRKQFIARLRRQAKGDLVTVDPVSTGERELWEQDPEVLTLRARIAANRIPKALPTTAEKQARYKERVLERIGEKMRGETRERAPSKWELTPQERAQVDADPEVRAARVELARRLAKLEKTGLLEAITAYRRAGLLTGIRTHMRNIGGNTGFQALEEVSRLPAAVTDSIVGVFTGRRTVSGPSPRAVAKASYEAATRGVKEAVEILKEGATEEQLAQLDIVKPINTGNRVFDTAVNMVFRTLAAEDRVFKVYAFERSLQEQMKFAKVETPTDAMRVKAWEDANFATFNNENVLNIAWAGAKARLRTSGPAGRATVFAMDLAVPFARTPSNILARVVDYAGPGAAARAGHALYRAMRDKGFTPEMQRELSMAMGRGMTGPALLFLGWWLYRNGLMTGLAAEQEGRRNVAEAAGRMPGSVLIGDAWQRIDTFSPVGNLLILGATLGSEIFERGDVPAAIAGAGKTVLEQPMLSGMSQITDTMRSPGRSARRTAGSLVGSFVPTMVADIATVGDEVRRDTRGPVLRTAAGRVPGVRRTLPERIDVFGETQEQRLSTAINPGIGSRAKEKDDPLLRELVAIDASIGSRERREGESDSDFRTRVKREGVMIRSRLNWLMRTPAYQRADAEGRRELVSEQIAKVRAASTRRDKAAAR